MSHNSDAPSGTFIATPFQIPYNLVKVGLALVKIFLDLSNYRCLCGFLVAHKDTAGPLPHPNHPPFSSYYFLSLLF